jgi:uncharacterized membrane protein YbhN (UPF0104 family)
MKIISHKHNFWLGGILILLIAGGAVFLLLPEWPKIQQTLTDIPIGSLLLLSLISIPMFIFRTEAWRVAIHSTDKLTARKPLYLSATVGFAVANVNGLAGIGAQLAALRRLSPNNSPTAAQLATLAVPVLWIEAMLCFLLLGVSATIFNLSIYLFPLILLVLFIGLYFMRRLERKSERIAALKGLAVIKNNKHLLLTTFFLSCFFATEIFRLYLALKIVGLNPSLFLIIAAFVSISVIGTLPIGAAATPTALVAIFSSSDLALAASAGLAFSVTLIITSCLMALIALPWLIFKAPLDLDKVIHEGFEFPQQVLHKTNP